MTSETPETPPLTPALRTVPTATAREHRLRIFQATRRPHAIRDAEIKTGWGHIIVTGRLGQSHADMLDAILYCAEKVARTPDGRIKLLVDPAKVRKKIRVGGEMLEKLARDLREATLHIKSPKELACIGGIIDHIDTAVRQDGTPITRRNPLTKGEREMWRVEIGKAFCRLLEKDAWLRYDPTPIAQMRHGISQAIARHVIGHKHQPTGGWDLRALISTVSGDIGDADMRQRLHEVRKDAALLKEAGVEIDGHGSRVVRVPQPPRSADAE